MHCSLAYVWNIKLHVVAVDYASVNMYKVSICMIVCCLFACRFGDSKIKEVIRCTHQLLPSNIVSDDGIVGCQQFSSLLTYLKHDVGEHETLQSDVDIWQVRWKRNPIQAMSITSPQQCLKVSHKNDVKLSNAWLTFAELKEIVAFLDL